MTTPLKVLSLGAGVQSTTVLLMSCRGLLPKLDAAVFADTQWEPSEVYEHLEWLTAEATKAGIPVHRVTNGNLRRHTLEGFVRGSRKEGQRYASLPLYVLNPDGSEGMVRRQCTREYKIVPIERFIRRELLGLKPGERAPADAVEQWFGISADEMRRVRISRDHWKRNVYPLVGLPSEMLDRPFTRLMCHDWLREHYPHREVPRSACIGCPYHTNDEWRRIKANRGRSRSCRHWRKREANALATLRDSFCIPVAGSNDGPGLQLSDDELRFIGWQLTDGHTNPHNQAIVITQSSRSPHNGHIKSVLDGCDFGYRVYRHKRRGRFARYPDSLTYVIPWGSPRGANAGKRGWSNLAKYFLSPLRVSLRDISQRQLGVLLEAMNLGDGHKPRNVTWTKRTITLCVGHHKSLADELQTLLIQRGYRCNIRVQQQRTSWHTNEPKPQYILHIRRQTRATIGGTVQRASGIIRCRSQFQPVPFDSSEEVWCLKTEYGTLVTRRNGKVAVLGNCGRGFRLHPSKENCLVLDFGGNILRHGPVDALQIKDKASGGGEAPAKECPQCNAVIHAAYATCPECGHEFPPPQREKHDQQASSAGILSGEVTETEYPVEVTFYCAHVKRGAPEGHPRTLRVDYRVGFNDDRSEWICVEHPPGSYARRKAEAWWAARSNEPCPTDADEAVELAEAGALAPTHMVTVRSVTGEKYDRIVGYQLGDKPQSLAVAQPLGSEPEYTIPKDQIPF